MNKFLQVLFFWTFIILAGAANAQTKTIGKALKGVSNAQNLVAKTSEYVAIIDAAVEKVEQSESYKTLVDGYAVEFPFAILPDNGEKKYALIVNSAHLDPVLGMTAEIFMKVPAGSDRSLYFLADAVPLSQDGSISGDFKLYLLRSESIKFGEGYDVQFNGMGSGAYDSTYITFNCRGFKDITLNGSLNFNPKTIVKHSDEGTTRDTLSLKFYLQADRIANMILKFRDVPAFQFKSLPGFKCTVPELTLDKSDVKNAPEFKLPAWYIDSLKVNNPTLDPQLVGSNLWEGVYIPSITIEIPKSFKEGSTNADAIVITSKDIIVDHFGITALNKAIRADKSDLFTANIKSFKIGVDSIEVNIIASKLSLARFTGDMSFLVCKEDSKLEFALAMGQKMDSDDLDYWGEANWKSEKPLVANAFGLAQFSLSGCSIAFEYTNKQFYPAVAIDGSMMVMPKSKTTTSTIGSLSFEFGYLVISSKAPYLDLGGQGISFTPSATAGAAINKLSNKANTLITGFFRLKADAESKISKLPVSVSNIELIKDAPTGRIGLGMVLGIKLQKSSGDDASSSNGFGGSAGFKIWTKRNPTTRRWGYGGFDLTSIKIGVDQSSFKLKGEIEMFEGDKVYGKGFCGYLELDVIEKINVKVAAIFGKKKIVETEPDTLQIAEALTKGNLEQPATEESTTTEYRYWFVDAFAKIPGIPLAPGVELNSFTGGVYYHMKMFKAKPADAEVSTVNCKTASGKYFSPDNTIGLGLLAGIGIQSTGGGNAYNGNINIGLQFATGGGLVSLSTWGDVGFFALKFEAPGLEKVAEAMSNDPLSAATKGKAAETPPANTSSVVAAWFIEYDVPNKTFVGDFDVFINLADVVKGIHANNKAGRISIYASPKDWYVYIGKPVEQIGIDILNLAQASSYLCIGSKLPTPPIAPIPAEIKADINIDYNLLSNGGGLSFGARLAVQGYPSIPLGICGARIGLRFAVKAGFDVLLSQANTAVYCDNRERGFKNWYATGQAYLYGEAALHASYDCWLGSDDFDLFSMYLSAFVFAQLPKPTYMKGEVRVGFSILKKSFSESFKMEFGDQCNSNTTDNNINFIQMIIPVDSSKEISVSEKITVAFSNPLETFHYSIKGDGNDAVTYRAVLTDASQIQLVAGTTQIPFTYELSDDRMKLVVTPDKVLPEKTQIKFTVSLITQRESNGNWASAGKVETKTVTFKTRVEPTTIPVATVKYAYPLPEMTNFYKEESTRGYVKLTTIPVKSVRLTSDYEFQVGIFENSVEVDRVKDVVYNGTLGQNNFTFEIPNRRLENNKKYIFKLMKSPKYVNSQETSTTVSNTETGTLSKGIKDTVILEYTFTTSKYATYRDKMSFYGQTFVDIFNGVTQINLAVNKAKTLGATVEPLSEYETGGYYVEQVQTTPELIQMGNMVVDASFLSGVNALSGDINTAFSKLPNGSISATTDVLSKLNVLLKERNLACLIDGGCTASQVAQVKLPAGKITVPIGYYLPGQSAPISEYQIAVELAKPITIPSN